MGQRLGQVMPPLDNGFNGNRMFYTQANWRLAFAWFPHRCDQSDQIIWLKFAYLGTAVWHGPGTPAFETHWMTKEEYLIWCLTNG
jgi:hypothetical protein